MGGEREGAGLLGAEELRQGTRSQTSLSPGWPQAAGHMGRADNPCPLPLSPDSPPRTAPQQSSPQTALSPAWKNLRDTGVRHTARLKTRPPRSERRLPGTQHNTAHAFLAGRGGPFVPPGPWTAHRLPQVCAAWRRGGCGWPCVVSQAEKGPDSEPEEKALPVSGRQTLLSRVAPRNSHVSAAPLLEPADRPIRVSVAGPGPQVHPTPSLVTTSQLSKQDELPLPPG